jgi:hypothetical protein
MNETLAEAKAQIAEMAREAFAQHVCERREGGWLCRRPGTSVYAFWVFTTPGAIVFYGDLGEAILRPSDRDALPWLRGAVRSLDYVIEKVRAGDKTHFYGGDALAWARSTAGDLEDTRARRRGLKLLAAALDLDRLGDLHQHTWAEAVNEAGFDSECCAIGTGHSSAMLWMVEALRWFVAHEEQAVRAGQVLDAQPQGSV